MQFRAHLCFCTRQIEMLCTDLDAMVVHVNRQWSNLEDAEHPH